MSFFGLGWGFPVLFILVPLVIVGLALLLFRLLCRRKARRFGYPSAGAYLRAAPRTDEEKRDAADMALKGGVICVLGMIFPPFILIGLVPLFHGGRKLVYASMGLGLVDDADPPRA